MPGQESDGMPCEKPGVQSATELLAHLEGRLSLEDARTHERHGFGSPEQLLAFLDGRLGDLRMAAAGAGPVERPGLFGRGH